MVVLLSAANSKLERRRLKDGPDRTSVELLKDTSKFLGHGDVSTSKFLGHGDVSRNDHTTMTAPLPVCSAKLSIVGPG
jgi:hypothetical protein